MKENNITVRPYPDIMGKEPLDNYRLYKRLREDGYVKKAEKFKSGSKTNPEYRRRSLIITWDKAPGARWVLNIPEAFHSLPRKNHFNTTGFRWETEGDRHCTLVYATDIPKGELRVDYKSGRDCVDIEISYSISEDTELKDVMCQACFNHLWAEGFGRDAYVLIGDKLKALRDDDPDNEKSWRRFITLKEEERYSRYYNPVYQGAHGKFIATVRYGNNPLTNPLTIAISSPDALAVSWSFWPCTDMDFGLGTVTPSSPGNAKGKIHFLEGKPEDRLDAIRVPAG